MSFELVDIDAGNFIDSYRNIGYSLKTAIADIIDNSIFAKATRIDINLDWDHDINHSPVVQIVDNGHGMNDEELKEAMRLACKSPDAMRDKDDLGRFGLGLKSASFSQCRILTVISHKNNNPITCKRWDIDHIKAVHRFELETIDVDSIGIDISDLQKAEGTIVQWNDIDKLDFTNFKTETEVFDYWYSVLSEVNRHIATTFGSFKNKIEFYFNGNHIELWDPFLVELSSTIIESKEFCFNGKIGHITSYVLPDKLNDSDYYLGAGDKGWSEQQGFYLYRNNRLIVSGSWLNIPGLAKREAYRLARIRIDIGNDQDKEWHIDIKKETAICPPELKKSFKVVAAFARTESAKKFRSRGKNLRRKKNEDTPHEFIWLYGTKGNGKPYYQIDQKHPLLREFDSLLEDPEMKIKFKNLMSYISNAIPVMSIVTAEADAKGNMTHNDAFDFSDEKIAESYINTVLYELEIDEGEHSEASIADFCARIEPYNDYYSVVEAVRKEKGWY